MLGLSKKNNKIYLIKDLNQSYSLPDTLTHSIWLLARSGIRRKHEKHQAMWCEPRGYVNKVREELQWDERGPKVIRYAREGWLDVQGPSLIMGKGAHAAGLDNRRSGDRGGQRYLPSPHSPQWQTTLSL